MTIEIFQGDCRELGPRYVEADSVDLFFTDPPWGIGFAYNNGYPDDVDTYEALVRWLVPEAQRVLRPGGFAFVYQATKRLRESWQWFPADSRLFVSCKSFVQLKRLPVEYAADYIVFWQKDGGGFPLRGMPRDWHIAKTHKTGHGSRGIGFNVPTSPPRPLGAVIDILSQMVPPGGLVVDYFVGSGTTAVACKRLGLDFVGFELDPGTCEYARERVAREQEPLFAGVDYGQGVLMA
jgi:DNA modification methylase